MGRNIVIPLWIIFRMLTYLCLMVLGYSIAINTPYWFYFLAVPATAACSLIEEIERII